MNRLNKANHAHYYGVPFHANFLKVLADKVINTQNYQQSFILVPSRRILRELQEFFLLAGKNEAILLPKIIPYSDMHSNALDWINYCPEIDISIAKEIDSLELKLIISTLCQKHGIPISKIDHLVSFVVKYYTFCDDLTKITNLEAVYNLISELENTFRKSENFLMQQIRQHFTDKLIEAWQETDIPIFAILPVNSIPYIDKFLTFLNTKTNAHIFLHGLSIENKADKFSEESECYYIEEFLGKARVSRESIEYVSLVNQSDQMIKLIDCHNYNDEAKIISLIAREHLEQRNQNIGIICDDNTLASHIKEALNKWHIDVDYTTQDYLFDTRASHLLFLILEYANDINTHNLLKIITHSFCKFANTGIANELSVSLRKPLSSSLNELRNDSKLHAFIQELTGLFEPFINQFKLHKNLNFNEILTLHFSIFRHLRINENINIQTLKVLELLDEVYQELSKGLELSLSYKDYYVLLKSILTNEDIPRSPRHYTESIIMITTVEARLQSFDMVIMANCNEKYFPNISEDISIVGTQKERELGFETSPSKIRLANYDFKSLISNARVYATRSWYINNQIQAPSRFLDDVIIVDEPKYRLWLNALHNSNYAPISRPQAIPTVDYRPSRISISAIEKLIRDPYAYYAEYILKIRKLDNIAEKVGNKDFGNIIHQTIAQIDPLKNYSENEYVALFMNVLDQQLLALPPSNMRFWKKRGIKIAQFMWEYASNTPITKTFNEVNGSWFIKLENHEIEIFFRADRVDILENSTVRVIDFKTGNIPSKNDIISGYFPQLAIECLAVKHGKIDDSKLLHSNVYAEYIELKGIRKSGQIVYITDEMQEYAEAGLTELLNMFYTNISPYFASLEHDFSMKTEHFKHLSRLDEWFENEVSKV
jgi:ATP-dependent helicase/nuclease subunit B